VGIRLVSIGSAVPGIGKVPGRQYTNKEMIIEHLLPHLDPSSFRPRPELKTHNLQTFIQSMFELSENKDEAKKHSKYVDNALYNILFPYVYGISSYISPLRRKFDVGFEKAAKRFTRHIGVQVRGIYSDPNDKHPTNTLAIHAGLDTINEAKKTLDTAEYSFDVKKIDGLICVSNTPDNVFPVHGKKIAQVLGIKARFYSNNQMACASIADAICTTGQWFKESKTCNVILILASDVTSRLRQPENIKANPLQNLIFGDAAAGLIFVRMPGTGGITVSNIELDNDAPDFYHRYAYTGDLDEVNDDFLQCGGKNDEYLKQFGDYESKVMANLVLRYLKTRNGKLDPNDKLILPEATSIIRSNGLKKLGDKIEREIKLHIVDSAVPTHGITGSPATAIAWKQAIEKGHIKPEDRVTYFNVALSGLKCRVTVDPNAEEIFRLEDEEVGNEEPKNNLANGDMTYDFEKRLSPFVELNGKPKQETIIDRNQNTVLEQAEKSRDEMKV